jgi:lipopolysaccharide export system protein LptA
MRTVGLFGALTLLAGVAGSANAQIGRGDAPVEVQSKDGEYLQKEGKFIYNGDVVATQADSRITTDKLTVVCSRPTASATQNQECEAIEQLIAEGNVLYTAPEAKIRGDRAEYDYPSDTITITGDVILSRGNEGVVRGTRVVYHVEGGITRITAGDERVLSIFTPTKRQSSPSTTAPQN